MGLQLILERKIKGTVSRWFGIRFQSPSETSKVRHWVLPYCTGKGCDVGFGGDKIMKVNCDGIDFPLEHRRAPVVAKPYTKDLIARMLGEI